MSRVATLPSCLWSFLQRLNNDERQAIWEWLNPLDASGEPHMDVEALIQVFKELASEDTQRARKV